MLIFKDVVTNEELMSDIFKFVLEFEDAIMKVEAHYKKPDEIGDVDIGCGNEFGGGEVDDGPAEAGDQPQKVLDVAANANLESVTMEKKEFMAYIKRYFKKVIAYLTEKHPERIDSFKKGSTEFVKKIVKEFDKAEFYIPQNQAQNEDFEVSTYEGGCIIAFWEDESAPAPVCYLFKDALVEEKC